MCLVAIRILLFLYDLITLPIFLILHMPWRKWNIRKQKWGYITNPNDPRSPYKSMDKQNMEIVNFNTIDGLFRKAVESHGNKKMFGTRQVLAVEKTQTDDGKIYKKFTLGDYKWITLNDADRRVTDIAQGLRSIGLNPGDKVVILAETRLEWLLTSHACYRTNIIVATCYTNLGEEGLIYGINQVGSQYLITFSELLPKIKEMIQKIPTVQHIIYFEDFETSVPDDFADVKLLSFSQLEEMGRNCNAKYEMVPPSPEDIAIIMYTSGSTGVPKGVLVPHKCFLYSMQGYSDISQDFFKEDDFYVAYLPLAHMYEQLAENFCLTNKVPIGYSSPLTLTDKSTGLKAGCKGDISLIKPSVFAAVPLMLDRIYKSVMEMMENRGPLAVSLFEFFVQYKQFWKKLGFETPILNRYVFNKMKELVGGRLQYLSSGGAPLPPDTHNFIETCLDVQIVQGYGLTETTGAATICKLEDFKKGRVGPPLSTCLIRLTDWEEGDYYTTDKPYPRGEVVIGGECVTAGYFKMEELTKECYVEEDGIRWFYSGDIAEVHPDGCFKIIDRKKDLLKLQFGEYVSLSKVESQLKTCTLVDNICVFGHGYLNYVVALVIPHAPALIRLAQRLKENSQDFRQLCDNPRVNNEATKIIQQHAKNCNLLRVEIPKYVKLCAEEWLPETGFVTATFKVRRKVIERYYKEVLDSMMRIDHKNSNST